MGIVILGAFALYLMISIGVVTFAIKSAKQQGASAKRWGWTAALVMYLIPFWDWLPTIVAHQYYCAMNSGFWVYKTADKWKADNPGGMAGLMEDRTTNSSRVGDETNHKVTRNLNQHFYWTTEKHQPIAGLSVYRWQDELVEKKDKNVVARRIGFSAGEGRDSIKFWLNISECPSGNETLIELRRFVQSIVIVNRGETQ